MKKYLLLFLMCVYASIGAWAGSSYVSDFSYANPNTVTITVDSDPDLNNLSWYKSDWGRSVENGAGSNAIYKVVGKKSSDVITSNGVTKLFSTETGTNNVLNLEGITFSGSFTNIPDNISKIVFASDISLPSGLENGKNLKYAYSSANSGNTINLYAKSGTTVSDISDLLTSGVISQLQNGDKTLIIKGTGADALKEELKNSHEVPENNVVTNPYEGIETVTGGAVESSLAIALETSGGTPSQVVDLTVSGGTLSDADVTYMTGTLTGLTTVDLTGTSATGNQIWNLLSSNHITSVKLGADNLAQLKTVSGKTFTSDILAKIGVSASSLASGMTTTNYFIDGTTLIVTGNIDSSVDNKITSILSENSSITTLDVANATNTSEYAIAEKSQITTVSLPASGKVTYGGSATKLIDGVLVVSLGEGGDYDDVAAMKETLGTLLGTVEHVKITGTLTESDLSNLFTADPSDNNKTLVCGKSNIKTLDLSDATKLDNSVWKNNAKGSPCETAVLLPAGTDLTDVTDWNGWGTNFFSIDGTNNKQLNLAVGYAGSDIDGRSLKNGTYFTEKLGATSLKVYNGRSGTGASGATALNAFATYSGDITLVDLTSAQANSEAGLAEARANLALTKTVLSPIESENLIVSGTITNDILATINALTGNIKSIDFSGVTGTAVDGNGNAFDWSNLTGPASVGYVLLPGSESHNIDALTELTNLKAAGALDGTKAALHVYNEETDEKGATNEFKTTFSDPFATATSLKLSSAAAMNTTSADLTKVIGTTVTLVDISEANFGELTVKDNLKLPQPSTTDLVVADGLNTVAGLNAYAVSGIMGVFSHDGEKLAMLSTGTNTNIASRIAAIKKTSENTLSVNSADYKQNSNGVTLADFNDVDVETLEFNQANYSSEVIANTHIKNLLMANANSAYQGGRSFDISGCTNLEKADFTQQLVNRINATNLDKLKDLYVNHATFKEALDKTASPKKGVVDVTRSSNNYDNLKIHAESAFDWNRVVPDLDKTTHYSDAANTPYIFTNAIMALHEPTETEKYCFWYGKDNDVEQEKGELKISMTNELRGTLGDILDEIGSKTFTKVTITGPMTQTDVAALSKVNAKTLDLSGATLQRAAKDADENLVYTNDVTVLNTGSEVNNNIRFVILPSAITRSDLGISYDTTNSDKTVVNSSLLSSFTGLYTALAYESTSKTFTTYVKKEGTMQPAVVAAGYGSLTSAFTPAGVPTGKVAYAPSVATTMDNLIVTGQVNAYDLAGNAIPLDTDGHLSYDKERTEASVEPTNGRKLNGSVSAYGGINGASLKIFDMKDAAFGNYTDMTLSALGGIGNQCKKIVISQVPSVKILPADFLNVNGIAIHCYCIPSNIEVIQSRAFITADYIWTTPNSASDPEGANTQLDNGIVRGGKTIYATDLVTHEETPDFDYVLRADTPSQTVDGGGTYTFSSSIKLIESGAFPDATPCVKDVYVLNTEAPECHVDAFNTVMYIGNGGYSPVITDGIITRDSYQNNGHWITMLHYPRQTTTPNVQRYTDPTRDYSIATGERDGKGAMIYYPNQSEFLRAYMQGTYGYTWNAWNPEREYGSVKNGDLSSVTLEAYKSTTQAAANAEYNRYKDIIDDKNENLRSNIEKNHPYYSFYDVTAGGTKPTDLIDYNTIYWDESSYSTSSSDGAVQLYPDGKDYRGWHQFVLNAYAANTTLESEPYRSYITDNEWWTICPTFDITYEQAIQLFGTPATGGVVEKKPYVSRLLYVRRDYDKNVIALNFSKNLMEYPEDRDKKQVTMTTDESGKVTSVTNASQHGKTDDNGVVKISDTQKTPEGDELNNVVMSAGVPYMIKPYMPNGNKRMFQVFKNGDEYNKLEKQYEAAGKNINDLPFKAIINETLYNTMHFALSKKGSEQIDMIEKGLYAVPVFVKGTTTTTEKTDGGKYTIDGVEYQKSNDYKYTFVGSFYKSYLPGRCYFLGWDKKASKAKFFYNDKPDANEMRWANETGIICPTAPDYTFKVTQATGGDKGEPAQWKIGEKKADETYKIDTYWLPGDDLVTTGGSGAKKYEQYFDSPDVISVVTGINEIDAEEDTKAYGNADVYSVNGQKVGTSLEGLPKGIYIVNGKKFIVK